MVKYIQLKNIFILAYVSLINISCEIFDGAGPLPAQVDLTLYYNLEEGRRRAAENFELTLEDSREGASLISGRTDNRGRIVFDGIFPGYYRLNAEGQMAFPSPTDPDSTVYQFGALVIDIFLPENAVYIDSLEIISAGSQGGLKINEIFYCGTADDLIPFYFYDQFIELYNSSEDTVYLDGLIIARMISTWHAAQIFRFPGEALIGRQYAIAPGEYSLLAQNAMNHQTLNGDSVKLPLSVDLSGADWEFRNEKDLYGWNDPDIPDIMNIETGYEGDFLLHLNTGSLLISDGSDLVYVDGFDLETIIDAVEYDNDGSEKRMDAALDRGFAGIGITRYSSRSTQRIMPGHDSDNSSLDFEILDIPTPGY